MTVRKPLTDGEAETKDLKEFFEERAAILEFDALLPRAGRPRLEAARITAAYVQNGGHLWASVRATLADYPVLLAHVPDKLGPVDALPAKLAMLKDKRVVRQGCSSGRMRWCVAPNSRGLRRRQANRRGFDRPRQ